MRASSASGVVRKNATTSGVSIGGLNKDKNGSGEWEDKFYRLKEQFDVLKVDNNEKDQHIKM